MDAEPKRSTTPRMTPELTAFCRGFLLTKCSCVDRACVFCRAFLIQLYKSF
jgi:inhibitor of KinA sporulation pathway (predicted exonuclease)